MDENKKRKVMIGTPSYDGKLDAWYVNSLIQTIKLSYEKNIDIASIWVSYDALVQRARNDVVAVALELECDDLIFIDSDIEWYPEWIYKLLDYKEDVVGGTYPKKTDSEELYPVYNPSMNYQKQENGLIEIDALATGFLKLNRKALQYLWDSTPEYIEYEKNNTVRRMIFDIGISENKALVSEDMSMCFKLKKGGFKIWLDPSMTCAHNGVKKYVGNFESFIDRISKQPKRYTIDDDTII